MMMMMFFFASIAVKKLMEIMFQYESLEMESERGVKPRKQSNEKSEM